MKSYIRPFLIALVLLSTGCATAQDRAQADPFEGVNRTMFVFNDNLDHFIVAPLSRGYRTVLPGFMERGVRNFFANLYDFNGAINAVLQGRLLEASQNGGRFVVNSTVGMLG